MLNPHAINTPLTSLSAVVSNTLIYLCSIELNSTGGVDSTGTGAGSEDGLGLGLGLGLEVGLLLLLMFLLRYFPIDERMPGRMRDLDELDAGVACSFLESSLESGLGIAWLGVDMVFV